MKNKITKKVNDHHKKMKKEARKMKALGVMKKKAKGNDDVPNLFP